MRTGPAFNLGKFSNTYRGCLQLFWAHVIFIDLIIGINLKLIV